MIYTHNDLEKIIDAWTKTLLIPGKPNEFETKHLLHSIGIPTPRGRYIAADTQYTIDDLRPPFVVKVCSSDILHKTDRGGVHLNVCTTRVNEIITDIIKNFPGAGVLVEEQIRYSGNEFIIGGLIDPVFKGAVMVGAGGILTEVYKDISFRLAPCTLNDARNMLDELLIAPVLNGYRNIKLDKEGLASIIHKVSNIIHVLQDALVGLDINPIVFDGDQWIILDAKLTLSR